ncbi:MAG TPA: restriction endonuclease subunit S, partial [Ilumatobacteraceae bacterium]|nr:restriction endonuclease subunit S [Ilumatobacteraceae bacterium]
ITATTEFMLASARPEQIERFRLHIGDTVITKDSETAQDIGIPAFVEYEADDLVCGYHLAIVRPEPRVANARYLYWCLSSSVMLRQWELAASGVTRVGIRSGALARAHLPAPPLEEQRRIADFLDA